MPLNSNSNSLDRKAVEEENCKLADFTDSQTDMSKADGSLGMGDSSSWHTVYKPTTVTFKYESVKGISRYMPSLKHILPIRVNTGPGSYMPVDMSGCCTFSFFSWLTPLVWRTFRQGLTKEDLYHCSPLDSCQINGARIANLWQRHVKDVGLEKSSLKKTLFKFIQTRLITCCLFYFLCLLCGFIGPTIFMRSLLEYIQLPELNHLEGVTWVMCLVITELLRITCFALMWAINIRTAVRSSSAVMSLLYRKILKQPTITNNTEGELVNLFANDCQKVFMMVFSFPLIIGGPIVLIGSLAYIWGIVGVFSLIGVAVFASAYGVQFGISYLTTHFRKKAIKKTDDRISSIKEFLNNIRLIKLYVWEGPLIESIRDIRANERCLLEKCQYLLTISSSLTNISSILATIFTILAYTWSGHDLTPAEAFTLLFVNGIASHGIGPLPMCIRNIANGLVALSRIQAVLRVEDHESYIVLPNSLDSVISVTKATLAWDQTAPHFNMKTTKKGEVNFALPDSEKIGIQDEISPDTALVTLQSEIGLPPTLTDISFVLPKGKLIGVAGSVGSGKSSLLCALLGQMNLVKGQVGIRGSVAYVSQQPWILNTTLRENILFGQLFSSKRYYEAVYCCGLTEDIASLACGDQTEVNERGTTLSGGQKQRTCLARAQYADKDLYLLDDPLSAVDYKIGRHIFQHCIKGALNDKSILFVTHQVKYLQECDTIILMRDGCIVEQGSHEELINRDSEYSHLVQKSAMRVEEAELTPVAEEVVSPSWSVSSRHSRSRSAAYSDSMNDFNESPLDDNALNEMKASGSISLDTYVAYMKAAGGFIVCNLVLIWFFLKAATKMFSSYWLSYWLSQGDGNVTSYRALAPTFNFTTNFTNQSDILMGPRNFTPSITSNPDLGFYQRIYGLSVALMFGVSLILGFLSTKASLRASSKLHDCLMLKMFRSPMHFFDITPIGRIINLFAHDTDEVDNNLHPMIVSFLHKSINVLFSLLLVVSVYNWFAIPFVLLAACFVCIQRLFRAVTNELKRFENVSRSPIYSHVVSSVQGLSTVRAFQKQEDFIEKFTMLVDERTSPLFLYHSSVRWLGSRMDIICLFVTLIIALFVVFLKEEVNPAFAALALTLVMQLGGMYQFVVRNACDLEAKFTSVERIQMFTEELESEAPLVTEKNYSLVDWPNRGRMCFVSVKMRYRTGLPLALRGISFDIEPQEKVGIVGKTGAGKSSIGAVLFRLVELTSGSIYIDGMNIRDLSLDDLRSGMSVVSQDPVLFQGTIRYNLDPFGCYADDDLWHALEKTHMKEKISMNGGLNGSVLQHGDNFSVGEKQLICVARALLRHSKIVLLDEATASIDDETDKLIQNTIQNVFADSTVLKIAHRLSTVMNCDRVMVISEGKIVEFEKPTTLLENPNSFFSTLMTAHHKQSET